MSEKLATLGLPKMKLFQNKVYDATIFVFGVTNKDSNCIVYVVMWPKFGNSTSLWEELSQPEFYKNLTTKIILFEGCSWFKFNKLRQALGVALKFYTSVVKGLKLKVIKFLGLIPTFVEVTREKLVGNVKIPPSWIGQRKRI